MCGICGFSGDGNIEDLERMTALLAHRGPDDRGVWHDPAVPLYLGHRRLSVLDLDYGSQPMWSGDGRLCVVFNGEIYNHRALRNELETRGHRFVTDHSDTEVLLYGYRQWGTDLPERLNGMWAFALYDRNEGTLFISRDRFGKKPLYYALQGRTFAFASELRALTRHPRIDASPSPMGLKKYFAYGFIPAPGSLYRGIAKLPGGHNLIVNLKDLSTRTWKYWEYIIDPFERIPPNPEQRWGERICELLENAVRRRLVADVPVGVFLSGGIDSSAVTAFAAKALGGERVKTFSIGFSEKSFDESIHARFAARHFHTDHHLETLSMERAKGLLPEIAARLDEPLGDASLLPTYLLARETRKRVTVALGGDGGDELFAGYDPFHALRLAGMYRALMPRSAHHALRKAAGRLPVSHRNISTDFKIKRFLRGLSHAPPYWNPVWLGPMDPEELEALFREPVDMEAVYSEAAACWESCPQENLVDKTLQFYTKLYLQEDILVKTDRASMMHGLEVRSPFLDIELVDFVRRIPHRFKYRNGGTKVLLKRALAPHLPRRIRHRRKKGFGVPVGAWFQNGSLSVDPLAAPPGMDTGVVRRKVAAHREKQADHRLFLWNLWLLETGWPELCGIPESRGTNQGAGR